jgi:hypothetical protein
MAAADPIAGACQVRKWPGSDVRRGPPVRRFRATADIKHALIRVNAIDEHTG